MPENTRNSFCRLDCTFVRISLYAIAHDELIVGGKGSTHSRGRSTSAPELSSSVALAPPSNGVGTSEELIVHIRLK